MRSKENISGRVVGRSGNGRRGARILAVPGSPSFPLDLLGAIDEGTTETVSRSGGEFRIESPIQDRGSLSSAARVYLTAVVSDGAALPLSLRYSRCSGWDFAGLTLCCGVRGRLHCTGVNGTPVHGASIALSLQWAPPARTGVVARFFGTTDQGGTIEVGPLPVSSSRTLLFVQHPEYINQVAEIDRVESLLRQPLRLRRGLTIKGRVIDVTGAPCERIPISTARAPHAHPDSAMDDFGPRAWTKPNGTFEVRGVPYEGGALVFDLQHMQRRPHVVSISECKRGRVVDLGNVRLPTSPMGVIRGVVVDAGGKAVAGATIAAIDEESGQIGLSVVSREDGRFELTEPLRQVFTLCAWPGSSEASATGKVRGVKPGGHEVMIALIHDSSAQEGGPKPEGS